MLSCFERSEVIFYITFDAELISIVKSNFKGITGPISLFLKGYYHDYAFHPTLGFFI